MRLHLHVAPLNAIERGVLDGQFQVGIIPGHRSSAALTYDELFTETMFLYCGARPPFVRRAGHAGAAELGRRCASTPLPGWATTRPTWN